MEETKETKRTLLVGKVISNKMQKTVVVEVERASVHPVYGKVVRRTKTYKVHDEQGVAKEGDTVEFYEGRPVSKTKYMYLSRIVNARAA